LEEIANQLGHMEPGGCLYIASEGEEEELFPAVECEGCIWNPHGQEGHTFVGTCLYAPPSPSEREEEREERVVEIPEEEEEEEEERVREVPEEEEEEEEEEEGKGGGRRVLRSFVVDWGSPLRTPRYRVTLKYSDGTEEDELMLASEISRLEGVEEVPEERELALVTKKRRTGRNFVW
jgi:hypothetical protein